VVHVDDLVEAAPERRQLLLCAPVQAPFAVEVDVLFLVFLRDRLVAAVYARKTIKFN